MPKLKKEPNDAQKRTTFPADIDGIVLKFSSDITSSLTNISAWYKALGQIIMEKDRVIKELEKENADLKKKVGKKKAAKLK